LANSPGEIIIYLGPTSPSASSSLPAFKDGPSLPCLSTTMLLDLAPHEVCLAGRVTTNRRWALTSPFHPSPVPVRAIGWFTLCCTCRHSSNEKRLPVRKHGALRCSDFPHF